VNNLKTLALMAGLMALFLAIGQAVGGSQGLILALALGSATNLLLSTGCDSEPVSRCRWWRLPTSRC
jgi:hypothetical protein